MTMSSIGTFSIGIKRSAQRSLATLAPPLRQRVITMIRGLAEDPRPEGAVRLTGEEHSWCVKVAEIRVVYEVHDSSSQLIVLLVENVRDTILHFLYKMLG